MKNFRDTALRAKIISAFAAIALFFVIFVTFVVFALQTVFLVSAAALMLLIIFALLFILLRAGKNEIDPLFDNLAKLNKSIEDLQTESRRIAGKIKKSEFGGLMQPEIFSEDILSIVTLTNSIISAYETELENMSARMEKLAAGEFSANMGYGQKSRHTSAASASARTLDEIVRALQSVAAAGTAGDFKKRLDAEKYSGDWQKLAHGINGMTEATATAIEQARAVTDAFAAGKLDAKYTADAKGEFHKLKVSSNNAAAALAKYTKTITHALENMDRRSKFLTDLPHDFAPVKEAIVKLGDSRVISSNASSVGTMAAAVSRPVQNAGDRVKKVSGAIRVDDLDVGVRGAPSYTQPDFGKY